jgi:plastocyanin
MEATQIGHARSRARLAPARRAAGALALLLGILAAQASAAVGGPPVAIVDRAYVPGELAVGLGQALTWKNESLGPHTVTSTTGVFDSGRLNYGDAYTVTFANPGTYAYYCTIHPTMKGSVIVLPIAEGVVQLRLGGHGARTVAHVLAARSGAGLQVQLAPAHGGRWKTSARGRLNGAGQATIALRGAAGRRVRVVVQPAAGQGRLVSSAVRAPA